MDGAQRRHAGLLPAIVLLAVVQSILAVKFGVMDGNLVDPDSYTWLNRVTLLHDTGVWFDSANPRIDPPHGHENHWSRPYDMLLLAGAWIASPVFGFDAALHGSGVLVNLVLHVMALVAVIWAFSPLLRGLALDVLGLLFVAQMGILVSYYVGRPDHQSLLNVLFIVSLGLMLRLSADQYRRLLGCAAGLVSALGIWVGIEFVLAVMAIQLSLGLFWAFGGNRFAEKSFHYSAALFVFTSIALFLEEGPRDFLAPMLDQISIAFVTLFALIALFWLLMYRLERLGKPPGPWLPRVIAAGLAGGVVIAAMNFLVPGFFSGPDPSVDKLYWTTRIAKISEGKPLVDLAVLFSEDWESGVIRAVFWLGIAVPALPLLIYKLVNTRGDERRFWVFTAVALAIYLPLVFRQIRWIPYPVTLLLPLYAIFVAGLMDLLARRAAPVLASPLRIAVLVLCSVGFLMPVLVKNETGPVSAKAACPLRSIIPYLNDPDGLGDRPRKLLAFVDFGPELLYRTKHSVYSYPNHRWQPGYTDSYRIFTATENDEARELVRKRQVDLILICPTGPEARMYAGDNGEENFHHKLSAGAAPAWLSDISPPSAVSDSFKLYRVQPPSS